MSLTDYRRRGSLLMVAAVFVVVVDVIPIGADQPLVPSPITSENKCGSCPCGNPCVQQSPPPPPPSPPPPSPPPPKYPTQYCPPPPPLPPTFFYFTGPPGYIYTVDPSGFPSGANRNLEKWVEVFVSFSSLVLWALWML